MAKGITQEQVNIAIDALIAAGERPTIERVRGFLGTGSPNTLTRMLEVWWENLGPRLTQQQIKVNMPDAPQEVAEAATQMWLLALEQGQTLEANKLESEKQKLVDAEIKLASDRADFNAKLETHLATASAAKNAQLMAETRLLDIQRLSNHQTEQIKDLHSQRDHLVAENKALTAKQSSLQDKLTNLQAQAALDKSALEKSHQAMQDRWLSEVDRARQESAKLATQVQQQDRLASKDRQAHSSQIQQLTAKLEKAFQSEQAISKKLKMLEKSAKAKSAPVRRSKVLSRNTKVSKP